MTITDPGVLPSVHSFTLSFANPKSDIALNTGMSQCWEGQRILERPADQEDGSSHLDRMRECSGASQAESGGAVTSGAEIGAGAPRKTALS